MKKLAWLLPAILLLAACSGAGSTTSSVPPINRTTSGGSADFAVAKAQPVAPGAAEGAPNGQPNGVPVPQAFDPDRALILTAALSLKASDPWAIADKAMQVATGLGGDVMGLSESGSKDDRVANLVLRVPSDRFNDALRQLRALDAEVVSSAVDGKDVTDQFVDLKARLAAKQSEEQRYLALLARADKIDDILKIDQSISVVRTQIEQLQGQVNSISSRTKFSTITMSITPAVAPVALDPKPVWDPSRTATQAFATLAAVLRGFADLAIWLLVIGWIPALVLAALVILVRGRSPFRTPA
jgi:uncharacterized protein DUF4349